MNIVAVLGVAAIVILVGAIGGYLWPGFLKSDPYAFHGGFWEPPQAAPELALTDQHGQPFSLEDHRGKVVLLYFGYTYCPDYCPTTLLETQQVRSLLGDKAADIEVVMVSVDPSRDTPERLAEYLAFFDPTYIGLTGTQQQIEATQRAWAITAIPATPEASGYLVSHSTELYAIDPEGNKRLSWPYGTSPEDIAEDIEHILS
jgi:protein SCO1/2